jgi:hypothetical protein
MGWLRQENEDYGTRYTMIRLYMSVNVVVDEDEVQNYGSVLEPKFESNDVARENEYAQRR